MDSLLAYVNPRRVAGRLRRFVDRRGLRTVVVRGVGVRMQTRSRRERERVVAYVTKEPGTLDWIDRVVKPGDVFFDVGANIGQYGIYAALRVDGVTVRFFEPGAANFEALNRNIALNGLNDSAVAYLVALSDATGLGTLHLAGMADAGDALHQLGRAGVASTGLSQGVVTMSLDALVYDYGLACPTHVKIDVDGHEQGIIDGAGRVLADPRLKSVLIEINDGDARIREAFTGAGFVATEETRAGVMADSVNVVFERA
jgi:FkbM family methyltransferase